MFRKGKKLGEIKPLLRQACLRSVPTPSPHLCNARCSVRTDTPLMLLSRRAHLVGRRYAQLQVKHNKLTGQQNE